MPLTGKNALITGASQGLGRAIARAYLEAGANVMLCARDRARLEATGKELAKLAKPDQKVLWQTCDVSSPKEVETLAKQALKKLESIQILVNNAGVQGPLGASESVSLEDWKRTIEINLHGVLLPARALIPHFKKADYGKIINLSGGGATKAMPMFSAYAASKAAVVRLTETLAEELKPHHIDVNAMAPGVLKTQMMQQVLQAGPDKVGAAYYAEMKKHDAAGGVPPERAAALCVYLGSAASDGITGRLITAQWDPWEKLAQFKGDLAGSDIYTLRRIVPEDRGKKWN